MGALPTTSTGNKYILVVTDLFSKWTEAFPLDSTDSANLATIIVNEVICQYRVSTVLPSDQCANLTSKLVSLLCEQLGIKQTQTTAYHPQGNGQVERFNHTLEAVLSKTVKLNQCDWDKQLPRVMFAYQTAIHKATGYTAFDVTFVCFPFTTEYIGRRNRKFQHVTELKCSLWTAYADIRQNLRAAHLCNKARYGAKSVSGPHLVLHGQTLSAQALID